MAARPQMGAEKVWARIGNRETFVSLLVALIPFAVAAVIGFLVIYGRVSNSSEGIIGRPLGDSGDSLLISILLRNAAFIFYLFSGTLTCGITSVIGVTLLGLYMGSTTAAAATSVGIGAALGSVIVYGTLEIVAYIFAAAAGILPFVFAKSRSREYVGETRVSRYIKGINSGLWLLTIALLLILLGAIAETIIIAQRA